MRRTLRLAVAVIVVGVVVALAGFAEATARLVSVAAAQTESVAVATAQTESVAVAAPDQPPDAFAGLEIFADRCAECHGPMGRGFGALTSELPAPPPNFADPEYMRSVTPAGAFEVVTDGRLANGMPPWEDELSAQERWDAIHGLWSFYYTPERLARGRAVWDASCAECHNDGADAASDWPEDDLLLVSQHDLLEQVRDEREEHEAVAALADSDVDLALDFARSGTFTPLPFDELSVDGTITGTVANGTDADLVVPGAYVRLVPFAGPVPGESITTTVDATGVYTFADVVAGPQIAYRLIATYEGSDAVHPEEVVVTAGGSSSADFEVFEPSTDEELMVRTAHIVVSPEPQMGIARVIEMWVVANDGVRTLVAPPGGATLSFALPTGATNLGVDDPALRSRASVDAGTLVLDAPIAPGAHEVVITYELPYTGTELLFERVVDLPTESLQLMAVAEGGLLTSDQLGPSEMSDMGGQSVVRATGTDLAPPLTVEATISRLPEAAATSQAVLPLTDSPIDAGVLGTLGLVLSCVGVLGALAYPFVSERRGSSGRRSRLESEYRHLVARLVEVDDRHAAGEIDDARYRDARAALMDRAMAVRRRLDEASETTDS